MRDYPTIEARIVPTCPLAQLALGRAELIVRVPESSGLPNLKTN